MEDRPGSEDAGSAVVLAAIICPDRLLMARPDGSWCPTCGKDPLRLHQAAPPALIRSAACWPTVNTATS